MTTSPKPAFSGTLTVVLGIGAVQGCWLYWLHWSTRINDWPAGSPTWFLPLLALGIFIPTGIQLVLLDRFRGRIAWVVLALLTGLIAALSAYQGWIASPGLSDGSFFRFPFWAAMTAIAFISLPFLQTRLATNTWTHYASLFRYSWQNALFLMEAALFTGVFWLLLLLWEQLFALIGIRFFRDLFYDPLFSYPVTAIVFSGALKLVAARENITLLLRRHALGLLLWLLPLVAFIAALFLAALPFRGLSSIGKAGVSTAMMLWTITFLIQFYNAAYQDGESPPPYPRALRTILRIAVVTLIALGVLSFYGLSLRVSQHGWSVSRVWAAAASALGLLYGLGYAAAAWRSEPWMGAMGKVNTYMALACLGLLLLLLSPMLSPHKITVDSQVARLLDGRTKAREFDYNYLRFSLGNPGLDALAALAKNETHPDKETIRGLAQTALAKRYAGDRVDVGVEAIERKLVVIPAGTAIDASFVAFLKANQQNPGIVPMCAHYLDQEACRVFSIDLNRDGIPEILAGSGWETGAFSKRDGTWKRIGGFNLSGAEIERAYVQGKIKAVASKWQDLEIDGKRYRITPLND